MLPDMYLCVRGIEFDYFCDFSIGLCNYTESVVYLSFIFWLSYTGDKQYAMHHNLKKIYVKNKIDYEIKFKQWWQKYNQYQQSEQSSLTSTHWTQKRPRIMTWEVNVMDWEKHKNVAEFHLITISFIEACC